MMARTDAGIAVRRGSVLSAHRASRFPLEQKAFMLRNTITAVSVWKFGCLSANTDAFRSLKEFQCARLCVGLLGRWMQYVYLICLWFSLPLSIWLSSGWVGLFVQWRAICGVSCLAEQNLPRRENLSAGIGCLVREGFCAADAHPL